MATGRLTSPRTYLHRTFDCVDGTRSFVFRETAIRDGDPQDPVVLIVQFRLWALGRNRLLHALFWRECILHTPLFAGFPGFQSKLWAADPASGVYRGLYEWDGAEQAVDYANHLVRLLNRLSIQGSVRYHVIPGCRREDFLRDPAMAPAGRGQGVHDWWRLTEPLDAVPVRLG